MTAPRVTIYEVGPRDGLQNEPEILDVAVRAELVRRLAATGLPAIELVSFVDPRRVPQMADAEGVADAVGPTPGVLRAGLALNERGYDRLVASGLDEVRMAFGVTDEFNRRNQGAAVEESLDAARAIVSRARADGLRATVTLSVAFGCPFEGEVDPGHVADLAARVAESEPDVLVLADTIGVAAPSAVRDLVGRVGELGAVVGGHFHNTRNTGYANALAALDAGVGVLDASVGGLGGCPFAPNATGNVATEDLVYALEREGVETGVDLDAVVAVASWMAGTLGRRLEGQLYRAGPFPQA